MNPHFSTHYWTGGRRLGEWQCKRCGAYADPTTSSTIGACPDKETK